MENATPRHPKWCDLSRCTVSADDTTGSHASRAVTINDAERSVTVRLVRPDQRTDAGCQKLDAGYRPVRLVVEPIDPADERPVITVVPLNVRQAHLLGRILRTPVAA